MSFAPPFTDLCDLGAPLPACPDFRLACPLIRWVHAAIAAACSLARFDIVPAMAASR